MTMVEDTITTTFECRTCGGPTVLSLPDGYDDDSVASCKNCGQEFGRLGDVKAKAQQEALKHVQGMLRDTFKGLKGWKVS
ncbi:ECs_2282 family putative zinc-binding protein [Caulobacter segnis]